MEEKELISLKPEKLVYVKRGVLYIQKTPEYIVELINQNNTAYVMVYHVQPGTEDNPKKEATPVEVKHNVFSSKTLLGRLANQVILSKRTKRWEPNPPVFVAPIVQNQRDTFTGKIESGFFEREPDRITVIGGERKLERGDNTGVFIGLSSIFWEDRISIPASSLVDALLEFRKEDSFFDFNGDNNNSNNPLSTYYKSKEEK